MATATFSPMTSRIRIQSLQKISEIVATRVDAATHFGKKNAKIAENGVRTRIFVSGRMARARAVRVAHSWPRSGPFKIFWALWQAIGEFLPRSSDDQVFHVKTKVVELLERNKNLQVYQRVSHTLSLSFTALCEGLWAAPS